MEENNNTNHMNSTHQFSPDASGQSYQPAMASTMNNNPGLQNAFSTSKDRASKFSKYLPYLLVVLGLSAFLGIIWVAYEAGGNRTQIGEEQLVLVKADTAPIKIKPAHPEGRIVAHQNRKVYSKIERTKPRMLSAMPISAAKISEQPLKALSRAKTVETASTAVAKTFKKTSTKPIITQDKPAIKKVESFSFGAYAASKPKGGLKIPTKTIQLDAKPALTMPAVQSASSIALGSYVIQVGAVNSSAIAQAEWGRLVEKHKDLLGGMTLKIEEVKMNGRSLFRVRGGMLTKTQASDVCRMLQNKQVACFVVKGK